jgi:RND family efflux transporter MFP subunit
MRKTLVALGCLVLAAGCGGRGGPVEKAEVRAIPVHVIELATGSATATVSATGTIRARDDVPISAEASGQVKDVMVKVGDRVGAGQVLVKLDDELAALAARQAEAQLLLAEAERDDAEANFARAEHIWRSGDISDAEYEAVERAAKSARAGFMAAEAGLGSAKRQLRNTAIESPIDGTVAFVFAEEGHLVAAGTPVAHVVSDRMVEIEIGLTEDQVVNVRRGRTATVAVRALPGETFEGRVEYAGPRADDRTKTYPVRVLLSNRERKLRAGMVAEVTIATAELDDVIVIERDWVIDRYGEPAVFVAADSLAAIRRLRLGRIIGDRVVVTSGLEPGDLLVTLGHDQLTENARISIKNRP